MWRILFINCSAELEPHINIICSLKKTDSFKHANYMNHTQTLIHTHTHTYKHTHHIMLKHAKCISLDIDYFIENRSAE